MRQILFVQGGGADTHDAWDHRLVASLQTALGPSWQIRYPRMPNEADPQFDAWTAALAQELASLRDDAILIGHSIGGTLLLHTLAMQRPSQRFAAIIALAAPFVGEGGWPADSGRSLPALGDALSSTVPVYLYHGLADDTVPPSHMELYAQAIPWARAYPLPGHDHQFLNDLSTVAALIRTLGSAAHRSSKT